VSAISLCILLVHVCYHTLPSHGCFRNLSLHSHNLDASSSLKQGKRKIMVERVQGFYVIGLLRHWAFTSYLLHRAFTLNKSSAQGFYVISSAQLLPGS